MKAIASLERRAFSLGAANAVDYGLQFILPIVLARALDVESFGHYRLFWLAVMTATTLVSIAMPQSLYFFLPRSEPAQKRLYINQTLVFLVGAGAVAAVVLSPLTPWIPESMHGLERPALVFPVFVLL